MPELRFRPFEVEGEQAFEDGVVEEVGGPGAGVEDGLVERVVREVEPGRALVVEVGEGSLLELGFGRALGIDPPT